MGQKLKKFLTLAAAIFAIGLFAGAGAQDAKAAAPTGTSATLQNSTATTVDIVITGTDFAKFISSGTTTANGTDLAKIHFNSTNPSSATTNGTTTITATFPISVGTGKGALTVTIDADAVEDASNVHNILITIANGSITDSANPILLAVTLSSAGNRNVLTFTYSEPMTLVGGNGASTANIGDITTAGTVAGIGSFATVGNVTVPTTKNTLGGSGTASITVTLANEAAGYMNSTSTTEPSGVFTPVAAGSYLRDAASLAVNPAKTPTTTGTGTWDLTKPTITSVTLADAVGNNGRVDRATVVFSKSVRDANITNGDATLGGGAGTFTTGTANDNTTAFNLTADTLAVNTSATAAQFDYSGATTKITDLAGNLLNTATPGTIADADIVETDGASPVLISVVLNRVGGTSGKNEVAFTYSEPITVTNGASTTTMGDITTAGTVAGFGSFATTGNVTVATTKNTVSGSGTSSITVVLAGQSGAFLNAASTTTASGNVTPLASASVVDAVGNQVNTSGAVVAPTTTNAWGLTKPTLSAQTYTDLDFNGTVDTLTLTITGVAQVGTVPLTDFTLTAGSLTGAALAGGSIALSSNTVTITLGTAGPAATTASANTQIAYTNPGDSSANHYTDDAGNQLATFAAQTLSDKAQPIIVTAVDQSSNNLDNGTSIPRDANIIITFSEAMDTTTLDTGSKWTISPDPGSWSSPAWSNSNKTVTLAHASSFDYSTSETVTLSAPLAVTGVSAGDKALKNSPATAAVDNPFTFTSVGRASSSDRIPPGNPINLKATAGDNQVALSWVNPADSDFNHERIYRSTISGNVGNILADNVFGTVYTDATAKDGTTYYYTVHPVDSRGNENSNMNQVSATPQAAVSVPSPTPSPTPTVVPGPATPAAPSGVTLYRIEGDNRVYVVKDGKKNWIKTADEFNADGYKWKDIVVTTPAVVDAYPDAAAAPSGVTLYRAEGDSKVYAVRDNIKQWIKTADEFNADGYKWADIIVTTPAAVASYSDGVIGSETIKIVNTASLRVRKSNSTRSAVLGNVKRNETFVVLEQNGGWYKIQTSNGVIGWVSGIYAVKQ